MDTILNLIKYKKKCYIIIIISCRIICTCENLYITQQDLFTENCDFRLLNKSLQAPIKSNAFPMYFSFFVFIHVFGSC